MDNASFEWLGECVVKQKRKRYQLHYTAFSNGDLHVRVGDYILIRNDDSFDPEECCYIAQVTDLYEADDGYDAPYRAVVQWFSRMIEFPVDLLESLDGVDYHSEVVKECRNFWSNIVPTNSILAKCSVIFLPTNVSPQIAITAFEATTKSKLFFCRWQFTGRRFEPVVVTKVSGFPDMKKTNRISSRKYAQSSNSKVKTRQKVSAPSSNNSSNSSTSTKNNTGEVPRMKTRASTRKSLASVQKENVESRNLLSTTRISRCLERSYNSLPNGASPSDMCQPLVVKLSNLFTTKNNVGVDRTPVKNFRLSNDSSPDKSDSESLKNGDISESENRDLISLTVQTTPVKRFYSPKKKPCRILDNSPYFKQFQSSHDVGDRETHLDSLEQLESPLKSAETEQSVGKKRSRCDKLESKKKDTHSSSVAKRNLFQNKEDDCSAMEKKSSHVRSLLFSGSDASRKEKRLTSTSRYGRTVKCRYSFAEIDNSPRKENTPRKRSMPKRDASHKKKSTLYNSDASDSGSAFSPSEESSEDENENCEEENPVPTNLKSPKVRSGGKSSSKKYKKTISAILSVPERSEPLRTPQNVLEVCRQRLHVSAVPKSLPCREDEYADIYMFVESNLTNGTGGCMYISGVPGTGKTATVFEVMRNLQSERDNDSVPPFDFVEINGMRMTDPHQSYVQIYKSLTGETVAPQQAADLLEKRFTKPASQKKAVVLVVDELDLLWTRKQTVMYNIFDWPSKTHSKLIVIAIANAMDLPERLLMSRISSRLGLTRKTFQPYTFKQLQEIVMCRIQEFQTFDPDAVQLVARKVAAVSGDARRALDVCRRATEIAEERKLQVSPKKGSKMLVGIAHVDLALQEMFTSPVIMAIKSCSLIQKMFLRGVVAEFQRTGLEETVFTKAYRQFVSLCRFEGIRPPNTSQVFMACAHLANSRLLLVDSSENDIYQKIRLNASVDDINYALSEQNV